MVRGAMLLWVFNLFSAYLIGFLLKVRLFFMQIKDIGQWFLNLSEVLNPTSIMQACTELLVITRSQGWKPGYMALGCQFQFRCVETQMAGFSFGLVSRLLKNRFQFRFQFCLRTTSVSGFQFLFKFHPKKLFYFKHGLCKCSTFERFCCIAMISSNSDCRVRRAIA